MRVDWHSWNVKVEAVVAEEVVEHQDPAIEDLPQQVQRQRATLVAGGAATTE